MKDEDQLMSLARIRWHAGLDGAYEGDIVPLCLCAIEPTNGVEKFDASLIDFIDTLSKLNIELNGSLPSDRCSEHREWLPRSLVYAVTEVIRSLRERREKAVLQLKAADRALWCAETAWSALLSGDIDNLWQHLEQEESWRF